MNADQFEYDIALSFAGEDRKYVEQVAEYLRGEGVSVFYDRFEEVDLWGKDLYTHLDEVYRQKARFCVMFLSASYKAKLWTNHERESAQARAFSEKGEYILPARFDDTEIPGVRPTTGYLDLRRFSPEEFGRMILKKINKAGGETGATDHPAPHVDRKFRVPKVKGSSFNPYDQAISFIEFLSGEIKERCDRLIDQGVSASLFEREGRRCLRIVVDGETKYSLDLWMGHLGGDSSIGFYGTHGESRASSGTSNAWGEIVWDKELGAPVLEFNDLSLLDLSTIGEQRRYQFDDFLEVVWNVICSALEGE